MASNISKEQLVIQLRAVGIKLTKAQLKKLDAQVATTTAGMSGMNKMMQGMIGFAVVSAGIRSVVKTGMEFKQSMKDVEMVTKATEATMFRLEKQARALGSSTEHTATSIAGLQKEYGKLGFTAPQIQKVTSATLSLASVTGADLVQSAVTAGATLRGFGMEAEEMERIVDVMAVSFVSSALDMEKFTDSMKYIAPIAKQAGIDVEGTTAMLGKLADAGIHGSMAGTSLRKILLEAGRAGSKLADRMGGPITSMEDFSTKLKKLRDEGIDPLAEGTDLVGARAVTAFSILLESADDVDTLTESLRKANGEAAKMAEQRMNTLAGDVKKLDSAFDEFKLRLFDLNEGPLRDLVKLMTDFINSIDSKRMKSYGAAIKIVATAFAIYRANIIRANIATKGFMATLAKTPWGLVAVGATYLVGSLIELTGAYEDTKSAAELEAEAELRALEAQEEHAKQLEKLAGKYKDYNIEMLKSELTSIKAKEKEANDLINIQVLLSDSRKELQFYKDEVDNTPDWGAWADMTDEVAAGFEVLDEVLAGMDDWTDEQIIKFFDEQANSMGIVALEFRNLRDFYDEDAIALAELLSVHAEVPEAQQKMNDAEAERQKLIDSGIDASDERLAKLDEEIQQYKIQVEAIEELIKKLQEKAKEEAAQNTIKLTKDEEKAIEKLKDMYFELSIALANEDEKAKARKERRLQEETDAFIAASRDIELAQLDRLKNTEKWQKASDEDRAKMELKITKEIDKEIEQTKTLQMHKLTAITVDYLKKQGTIKEKYEIQEQEAQAAELERVEELKEAYGGFFGTLVSWVESYAETVTGALDTLQGLYDGVRNAEIQGHKDKINEADTEYNTQLKNLRNSDKYKNSSRREQEKAEQKLTDAKEQQQKDLHNKIAKAEYEQAKVAKGVAIAQMIVNTALATIKALPNYWLAGATAVLGGIQIAIAAATPIPQPVYQAQFGMNQIVDKPTNLLVGEGSGPELVQVTPLTDENRLGPGGGDNISINISGNIMSEDYTEDVIIPQIREALRRGESI